MGDTESKQAEAPVAALETTPPTTPRDDEEAGPRDASASSGGFKSMSNKDPSGGLTTEVEQIAERIETRRANRIPVTFDARVRFLKDCRRIAQQAGGRMERLSIADLKAYREKVKAEYDRGVGWDNVPFLKACGFLCDIDCLLATVDRAVQVTEESDYEWLYYRDFNFDHTHTVSRFPMLRDELRVACMIVFLYYFLSCILFCNIMNDSDICGADAGPSGARYLGWVSTLYFASTTMSTVGYGDLSVSQDPVWESFVGTVYMLVSILVGAVAFSAAASVTVSPLENMFDRVFEQLTGRQDDEQFLHERIRRIRVTKITEITLQITVYIAVGVFAARIAVRNEDDPERQWNWMTSIYWAVQTTTTIGYGDLAQPFGLRYFKIVYLMLSTIMVGNAFGKLASLRDELVEARRQHAWSRRSISRRFIDEMQAYNHDEKVDQYEFLVASLISLGKVSSEDIRPIMEKFRSLAGPKGYIAADDSFSGQLNTENVTDTEHLREDALIAHE